MKTLLITAAALTFGAQAFAQTATEPAAGAATDAAPMTAPAAAMDATTLSEANPGISADWFEGLAIYTTNQPSTTAWDDDANWGTARPDDWTQIGEVEDVILSAEGQVIGYSADIGGFLGMGERNVLLSPDMVRLADFDDAVLWGDSTVFVTNHTQEELEALPEIADGALLDD
mgnify:CR=1 FL=1